jgi:O-antigen ligase
MARVDALPRKPSEGPDVDAAALIWRLIYAVLLAAGIGGLYWLPANVGIWLAVLSLLGIIFLEKERTRIQAIDCWVILIAAYEFASLAFSQYAANGVFALRNIVLALCVYFTLRLTVRTLDQASCLSGVLGLGGAALSVSGIHQFAANVGRLRGVGLTSLVAFRFRLITPPAPWVQGEWFTALLLALPFAFAFPVYLWWTNRRLGAVAALLPPALILILLTLSLSRAVFWSAIVFLISGCALMIWCRITTFRKGATLFVSAMAALALLLAVESLFYPGLPKAYAVQQASQVRSSEGRVVIWQRSLEIIQAHPLWGVGSSNAALALLSSADADETTGFASRTFSLPLQVLVEKGIIGSLLYVAFLVLVARDFLMGVPFPWRRVLRMKRSGAETVPVHVRPVSSRLSTGEDSARIAMNCCFAAGLVAVLARELVYSSILEHTLTLVLVAMLSALLVRSDEKVIR